MKARVFTLTLAILVASVAAATAQIRGGTVEINPFAGYLFGGSFARGTTDFFPDQVDVADDVTYGGRVGYNITSMFEAEFQYSQTTTTFETGDDFIFDPQITLGDFRQDYYMAYATFNFGHSRFVPYFTIGSGASYLKASVPGFVSVSDTRYTGSLGGGFKVFLNPHFALRFDGRAYWTYLGTESFYCGYYYSCSQTEWLTNGEASGGLIVAF